MLMICNSRDPITYHAIYIFPTTDWPIISGQRNCQNPCRLPGVASKIDPGLLPWSSEKKNSHRVPEKSSVQFSRLLYFRLSFHTDFGLSFHIPNHRPRLGGPRLGGQAPQIGTARQPCFGVCLGTWRTDGCANHAGEAERSGSFEQKAVLGEWII